MGGGYSRTISPAVSIGTGSSILYGSYNAEDRRKLLGQTEKAIDAAFGDILEKKQWKVNFEIDWLMNRLSKGEELYLSKMGLKLEDRLARAILQRQDQLRLPYNVLMYERIPYSRVLKYEGTPQGGFDSRALKELSKALVGKRYSPGSHKNDNQTSFESRLTKLTTLSPRVPKATDHYFGTTAVVQYNVKKGYGKGVYAKELRGRKLSGHYAVPTSVGGRITGVSLNRSKQLVVHVDLE